jgi:hypothetical protein
MWVLWLNGFHNGTLNFPSEVTEVADLGSTCKSHAEQCLKTYLFNLVLLVILHCIHLLIYLHCHDSGPIRIMFHCIHS